MSTSSDMTTVFNTEQPLKKKLLRTNQGSYILGGSFSNRDNVRAPIQFRRESQPPSQFSFKNRPIHFHINRTSVFRLAKRHYLSFSSIEINKSLPVPVQCLVGQIQVHKPILVVARDHMPDH